jgi:glycosyltransferase involved in cell wall biosynthesis
MRKKVVLFHSDSALIKTGFGRVMKCVLKFLYKTKKYELHHLCCGTRDGLPAIQHTPWKSHGAIPGNAPANVDRSIAYGKTALDDLIKKIKPDVYIGMQDFWGLDYSLDKKWFKKITSCIWTTLDSLPLLGGAIERAKDIKNYWVWSNFAEKEMHRLGFNHVRTMHGPIETSNFYRIQDEKRKALRKKNSIPEDSIVCGFVFRNQLRKLVPNLLEGYKIWRDEHPEIKNAYLILHTNFSEGWSIPKQVKQNNIDPKEILATYVCEKCGEYQVKSYFDDEYIFRKNKEGLFEQDKSGNKIRNAKPIHEKKNCPYCKSPNSQNTINISQGVTEKQLNEIYNLMDVYVHPFTSGGQEIPIQEAKLTELITLVTNYSCGEECCEEDAHSMPLEWTKYYEHGTEFIKASTIPGSIAEQLNKFINLNSEEKSEKGKKAREWVIKGFSIESIGKKLIEFIDQAPLLDQHNEELFVASDDDFVPDPDGVIDQELNDEEWLAEIYQKILGRKFDEEGFNYWIKQIAEGKTRPSIEAYFRSVAKGNLSKKQSQNLRLEEFFGKFIKNKNKKKILFVIPKSIGDCFLSTSIISSLRSLYKKNEWDIYVSSEAPFKGVFEGNEGIEAWIPYNQSMENHMLMEGAADHEGWFDICFTPHLSTQKTMNYIHNGLNKMLL